MKKTNSTTKAMIALIATDAVITTATAIASAIKVRNNRKAEIKKAEHKPEVKMGMDIHEYLPMIIPGNSPSFAEKVIKAFCDIHNIEPDEKKIQEATKNVNWDFWYCSRNEKEEEITIYCRNEKTIKFEFRKDSVVSELEMTIVSDGESDDDEVIRTKITRANYSTGNSEYYSRSYDHETFEEALSTPEFRFLKESFNFKIVPEVEYNN